MGGSRSELRLGQCRPSGTSHSTTPSAPGVRSWIRYRDAVHGAAVDEDMAGYEEALRRRL
jgi:hypothetical protein